MLTAASRAAALLGRAVAFTAPSSSSSSAAVAAAASAAASVLVRSASAVRSSSLPYVRRCFVAQSRAELRAHLDTFARRHIGPNPSDTALMLAELKHKTLDELTDHVVPTSIRFGRSLRLGDPLGEQALLAELRAIAARNASHFKSFIGAGYYGTVTPPVILRNLIENPQWYTPYTPYQAEMSQGRLEALLHYQTVVSDLTGLEVSNASLLDEATAAAEAMLLMARSARDKKKTVLVDRNLHPQSLNLLRTRSDPMGVKLVECDLHDDTLTIGDDVCGVILQYPDTFGAARDFSGLAARAHEAGALVAVGADLLSLCLLKSPGSLGADIAFGSSQRFGVPLGYGGPHAAFFATHNKYVRVMPGRIVGMSRDAQGNRAYRMALQTREQHIRRERATSNICTAQALLANTAAMYAMYHGPAGLRSIASRVHTLTTVLRDGLAELGYDVPKGVFFDTIRVDLPAGVSVQSVLMKAREKNINLRQYGVEAGSSANAVGVSFDETTTLDDAENLVRVFAAAKGVGAQMTDVVLRTLVEKADPALLSGGQALTRQDAYLTHPEFNTYHSETEMMRLLARLSNKDVALTQSMIPLGSCTMKLNAAAEMIPVTFPGFSTMHPLAPADQAEGYAHLTKRLAEDLCEITGFSAFSLQPNSGAQGELAGLLTFRNYFKARNELHRDVCLIPSSAHGTNPASAALAGLRVVIVKCRADGSVDVDDLRAKAKEHASRLACAMVTYPSTYGIFDEEILAIIDTVHENGGQVYMDGANLNAQLGLCRPADMGADCLHINLHKTFCIPHGGGGPGMGPVGVREHLVPHLPTDPVRSATGAVSAANFGSASILPISYAFIRMMGGDGLKRSAQYAILAANYMKARLEPHYKVAFRSARGLVAHEVIIDMEEFGKHGVEVIDVAKRLQDFGFHGPTMSWPVRTALMIEPTESENKAELDRYCEALITIRKEIQEVIDGKADKEVNVLTMAPHTASVICSDKWDRPYSREKAAFPLPWVRANKFWPSAGRLDEVYGDRNLVCTCPPVESYASLD